jgi:hypothetical protein
MNLSGFLKSTVKNNLPLLTRLVGVVLLNKKQTEIYLQAEAQNVFHIGGEDLLLPEVPSLVSKEKCLFAEKKITTTTSSIWKYQNNNSNTKQLRNGSIAIKNRVLDLGFGNNIVAKDLLKRTSRAVRTTKVLIAPWSHYWTGYFDYIAFVALNICRIKALLSPEEFANAVVSYPLAHSEFEGQLLEILGVRKENLVDSRETAVAFETCFVGNNDSWFYPNKENILLFKSIIESKIEIKHEGHSRIYIQRAGRRKVLNEAALLLLLAKYDIAVIGDIPRSLAEQVSIYRNASFIIGPHGASFANILWCRPGTQLIELFANSYMPEYFRYLTQILDLKYAAYCHGEPIGNDHAHVADDVSIDLVEVEQCLQLLLK